MVDFVPEDCPASVIGTTLQSFWDGTFRQVKATNHFATQFKNELLPVSTILPAFIRPYPYLFENHLPIELTFQSFVLS